ncbi:UNVERIFIED_CONTAM: hypothetical protein Sangu_1246300 [Sesamum angustifolium]|uniref:Uncharacterized protein n=1 Tax=Sesamum angustifolium TaxID=2727405 RepID=A0AAW2NJ42_9LAMI
MRWISTTSSPRSAMTRSCSLVSSTLLPLSRLKHRLQAEEMAALAVKASSALTKSGGNCGDKCGCRRNILVFPGENPVKQSRKAGGNVGETGSGGRKERRKREDSEVECNTE